MRCCVSTKENLHLMMVKTPDGLPLCFSCSFLNILPFAVSSSVALLHQQHHMQFFLLIHPFLCLVCPDPHLGVADFRLHLSRVGECFSGVAARGPGGQRVMDGRSSRPLLSIP